MTEAPTVFSSELPGRSARRSIFQWLLALGALAYIGFFVAFPAALSAVGVNYLGVWFLDSFAILAANDALARGWNVYAANPLDYLQRPHVYSDWWLSLGKFGLTRADHVAVGLTLVLGFYTTALWRLRPRTIRETIWCFAVLCCPPVLLAVHRANNDLVIFVLLAAVVPCLLSPRFGARLLAGLIIAIATGLKFYPASALLILLAFLPVTSRLRGWELAAGALATVFVLFAVAPDIVRAISFLPQVKAEALMSFGAINLWSAFQLTGTPALLASAGAAGLATAGWWWRLKQVGGSDIAFSNRADWLRFVLGAALLTGCFFSGVNFAYRWVFGIWLAPFLWQATRASAPPAIRSIAKLTSGLLLVALWADGVAAFFLTCVLRKASGADLVRWANQFFLLEQPVTWALFVCLIGWLVLFVQVETRRGVGVRPTLR